MFLLFLKALLYVFNVFKRVHLVGFSKIAKKYTCSCVGFLNFLIDLGYKRLEFSVLMIKQYVF